MELRIFFILAILLHCVHKNVKCSESRRAKGKYSSKPGKSNPRSTASSNQASREKTRRKMFSCCGKNKVTSQENVSEVEKSDNSVTEKAIQLVLPEKYEVFVMEIRAKLENLRVSISKEEELHDFEKDELFGILLKQREAEYYKDARIYWKNPRTRIRKYFDDPDFHFLRLQNEKGVDVAFAMFKLKQYLPGGDEHDEASTSSALSDAKADEVQGLFLFDIGIDTIHRGNHYSIVQFIVKVLENICRREEIIVLFTNLYKKEITGQSIFYLLGFRFNLRNDSRRKHSWCMYKDIVMKKNKKIENDSEDENDSNTKSGKIATDSAVSLLQKDKNKINKLKLPSKYKTCSAKKHEILSLILSPNYHLTQKERSEMYDILLENMSEYYENTKLHSTNPKEKVERIIGKSKYIILRVINEQKECVAFAIFLIGKYYDDQDAMELVEVQERSGYRSDRLLKFMINALEEICVKQNVRVMYIHIYTIDATSQQRYEYLGFTQDHDNPYKVRHMRTYSKRFLDQSEDPKSLTKSKSSPDEKKSHPTCLTRSLST